MHAWFNCHKDSQISLHKSKHKTNSVFLSCLPLHTFNHHLLFRPNTTNYKLTKPNQNCFSVSVSLCVCSWARKKMMMLLDLEAEAQTRDCFHGNLLLILDIVLASINGILATIAFSQVSFLLHAQFSFVISLFSLFVGFVRLLMSKFFPLFVSWWEMLCVCLSWFWIELNLDSLHLNFVLCLVFKEEYNRMNGSGVLQGPALTVWSVFLPSL